MTLADLSSDFNAAAVNHRVRFNERHSSINRRSFTVGIGSLDGILADQSATVYAEFTFNKTASGGSAWGSAGQWVWSVMRGRGCQFTDQVYVALARQSITREGAYLRSSSPTEQDAKTRIYREVHT